jgi:hypothetical protein
MSKRVVNVHLRRNGDYLIEVYSRTVNGFMIGDGLTEVLPPASNGDHIGVAVVRGLQRSREGLPAYDKSQEIDRDFLDFVGMPTYERYARGVRMVGVKSDSENAGEATVVPKANGGAHSGFTSIRERAQKASYKSPSRLGHAVLDAFKFATA